MFGWFRNRKHQPAEVQIRKPINDSNPESFVVVRQNKSPYRDETSKCIGFGQSDFIVTKKEGVEDQYTIAVFFFQNDDGTRFYELEGKRSILIDWIEDKSFEDALRCEIWVRTGIKPPFYLDTVLEKLKRNS